MNLFFVDDDVFEIKETAGDYLGEQDFDSVLVDDFVTEFKHKNKSDLTKSKRSMRIKIMSQCERAKRTLSAPTRANIEIGPLNDIKQYFNGQECKSIAHNTAVAYGAVVQTAVVSGERGDVLLVDVTPSSLGIDIAGGIMKRLIEISCETNETLTTCRYE